MKRGKNSFVSFGKAAEAHSKTTRTVQSDFHHFGQTTEQNGVQWRPPTPICHFTHAPSSIFTASTSPRRMNPWTVRSRFVEEFPTSSSWCVSALPTQLVPCVHPGHRDSEFLANAHPFLQRQKCGGHHRQFLHHQRSKYDLSCNDFAKSFKQVHAEESLQKHTSLKCCMTQPNKAQAFKGRSTAFNGNLHNVVMLCSIVASRVDG